MKIIILSILLNFIFLNTSISTELIYETNYHNINIENNIILDSKIQEIDKIKNISLNNILKRIVSKDVYLKLIQTYNFQENINSLIKNIIIENEFISNNKYSADVKINYKNKEIIDLLRNYKINYSDYQSPEILMIISETNNILKEGMSNNNSVYKILKSKKFELINLIYPNLNPNDRFILPFSKIQNNNIDAINKIAIKYSVKNVLILNILKKNHILIARISFYSTFDNNIDHLGEINLELNSNFENDLYNFLNNWWKNKHEIDNSILNNILCSVSTSSISEMQYINSTLHSFSQMKSINLKSIKFGLNTIDLSFYGNILNLQLKLLNKNINLNFNSQNECLIKNMI